MDCRCPVCGADLGRTRKLSQAIVVRMDIDCPRCNGRISLNIHPAEHIATMVSVAAVLALGAAAYFTQSRALAVAAFCAVMLGALVLPLLETIYLRTWPRYVRSDRRPDR